MSMTHMAVPDIRTTDRDDGTVKEKANNCSIVNILIRNSAALEFIDSYKSLSNKMLLSIFAISEISPDLVLQIKKSKIINDRANLDKKIGNTSQPEAKIVINIYKSHLVSENFRLKPKSRVVVG